MACLLFTHACHHIFNLQRPSTKLSPLVNSTFAIEDTTFIGTAMLNSGCSTWVVPISQLPKEARKHMTHSDIHVKGINGSITILGELNCDITISNHNSSVFKEINLLVTAQAILILISQNILSHDTLNPYLINNHNAAAEFRRTLTSGHMVHTTPIIPASTSTYNPAYGARTTISHNQPTMKPQPNTQTLDQ